MNYRKGNTRRNQLQRDLRASVFDGIAFGAMVGLGETYLPAFALAIGLGEMVAGMVGSVPLIVGGLMQLASPTAVRLLGSHRQWVVLCAIVQGLSFLPLMIAAIYGSISTAWLLLIAAIYWGTGLATGPAWNTWIGTIVPSTIRPRFFANRTRLSQAGVFAGFIGGGVILHYAEGFGRSLEAFALLFLLAGVCRLFSAGMLQLQSEPIPVPKNMKQIPWKLVFHHLQSSGSGRLLVYLVVVQGAAQTSGPFFTPFMLKQLHFDYKDLAILLSVAFLSKVIALPFCGQLAKKISAQNLLWLGGIGIVPISAGWIVSQNFGWLLLIQIIGGVVWAAYELAFFLLFFESISDEERTSVLTIYNLLHTSAWVLGSLTGGLILLTFETSFQGYLIVFGVSSVGRLAALLLLARVPRLIVDAGEVGVRTVAVRPGSASVDTPVLPSLPDRMRQEDSKIITRDVKK